MYFVSFLLITFLWGDFSLHTLEAASLTSPGKFRCLSLIPIVGNVHSQPYKAWDSNVSGVRVKTLVDQNTSRSHSVMMGAARIETDLQLHQHAAAEIYYITKGRGRTFLGTSERGHWVDLEAGVVLYLPSGLPHYTISDPKSPVELIYVFPRDNLKDVKYVFDGSLSPLSQTFTVNKLSMREEYPSQWRRDTLVERSEFGESGLSMEHLRLGAKELIQAMTREAPHIFFVRHGRGFITVRGQRISVKEGSYLYVEEGSFYSIQSEGAQGLDILIFQPWVAL